MTSSASGEDVDSDHDEKEPSETDMPFKLERTPSITSQTVFNKVSSDTMWQKGKRICDFPTGEMIVIRDVLRGMANTRLAGFTTEQYQQTMSSGSLCDVMQILGAAEVEVDQSIAAIASLITKKRDSVTSALKSYESLLVRSRVSPIPSSQD
eukprot:2624544-Rhodomonas_salina.1